MATGPSLIPLGELTTLSQTQSRIRRGYFLPILLPSRFGTQGSLVRLLNWYPTFRSKLRPCTCLLVTCAVVSVIDFGEKRLYIGRIKIALWSICGLSGDIFTKVKRLVQNLVCVLRKLYNKRHTWVQLQVMLTLRP